MNSRQGSRYIKTRLSTELKNKILEHNGITTIDSNTDKPTPVLNCPRCDLVNVFENKFCSKCSYPLKPEAFDEIKHSEEDRIRKMEERYQSDIKAVRKEMEEQFKQILSKIEIQKMA